MIPLKVQPIYGWQCPYCLQPIGYLGRFFAWLFGARFHRCDESNIVERFG